MNQELKEELELLSGWDIPEHDVLEFLLEKLKDQKVYPIVELGIYENWWAKHGYLNKHGDLIKPSAIHGVEATPTEAVMVLAVKLLKKGILTK